MRVYLRIRRWGFHGPPLNTWISPTQRWQDVHHIFTQLSGLDLTNGLLQTADGVWVDPEQQLARYLNADAKELHLSWSFRFRPPTIPKLIVGYQRAGKPPTREICPAQTIARIGRGEKNRVTCPDRTLSGQHFEVSLQRSWGQWRLRVQALASTNGTWVYGRLGKRKLSAGRKRMVRSPAFVWAGQTLFSLQAELPNSRKKPWGKIAMACLPIAIGLTLAIVLGRWWMLLFALGALIPLANLLTRSRNTGDSEVTDAQLRLPASVTWDEILEVTARHQVTASGPDSGTDLAVCLGIQASGHGTAAVHVDFLLHGPHALVFGTTGSGKSALLQTLLFMAALSYSPRQFQLVLIDFKGGASFGLAHKLPHVVGTVTDLDIVHLERALLALEHTVQTRKALCKTHEASGIAELDTDIRPARLMVVIDEFQEFSAQHQKFLPQLFSLAAQGRSLGIHLVLATQKAQGNVSADMLANISIRIGLRVTDESSAQQIIHSTLPAQFSAQTPGRFALWNGEHLTIGQGAFTGELRQQTIVHEFKDHISHARALWSDPLLTEFDPEADDLNAITVQARQIPGNDAARVFAQIDAPLQKTPQYLRLSPSEHCAFFGDAKSGKTSALLRVLQVQRDERPVCWVGVSRPHDIPQDLFIDTDELGRLYHYLLIIKHEPPTHTPLICVDDFAAFERSLMAISPAFSRLVTAELTAAVARHGIQIMLTNTVPGIGGDLQHYLKHKFFFRFNDGRHDQTQDITKPRTCPGRALWRSATGDELIQIARPRTGQLSGSLIAIRRLPTHVTRHDLSSTAWAVSACEHHEIKVPTTGLCIFGGSGSGKTQTLRLLADRLQSRANPETHADTSQSGMQPSDIRWKLPDDPQTWADLSGTLMLDEPQMHWLQTQNPMHVQALLSTLQDEHLQLVTALNSQHIRAWLHHPLWAWMQRQPAVLLSPYAEIPSGIFPENLDAIAGQQQSIRGRAIVTRGGVPEEIQIATT